MDQVVFRASSPSKHNSCEDCGKTFTRRSNLKQHLNTHREKTLECSVCGTKFTRYFALNRHMQIHKGEKFQCEICQQKFTRQTRLNHHILMKHSRPEATVRCGVCNMQFDRLDLLREHTESNHSVKQKNGEKDTPRKKRLTSSALNLVEVHTIEAEENQHDFSLFLEGHRSEISEIIRGFLRDRGSLKWYLVLEARYTRRATGEHWESTTAHFRSVTETTLGDHNMDEVITRAFNKIVASNEAFVRNGSGWILQHIEKINIQIARYQPLSVSSYFFASEGTR